MKNGLYRYQKVKHELLQEIMHMVPNEKMKSRPRLVKEYNVTRTTIDKAISELIGEGYLYAKNGSGTFVTKRKEQEEKSSHTGDSWGVIIPDIRSDVYPGMVRGIEDIANRYQVNVLIGNTDNQIEKQEEYIHKFLNSGVKGIIIVPTIWEAGSVDMFQKAQNAGVSVVFCNRSVAGVEAPLVLSNNFYGSYMATKYAMDRGYQRIAYMTRNWYPTSTARLQGYLSALSERGVEPQKVYYSFRGRDIIDVEQAVCEMLRQEQPPDAIICFNDSVAWDAYHAAERMGISIGTELGLIGYANTALCEQLPVKLTSVSFKTYEIGEQAAILLLDMTNGKPVSQKEMVVLQPSLVIRESCKGLARNGLPGASSIGCDRDVLLEKMEER